METNKLDTQLVVEAADAGTSVRPDALPIKFDAVSVPLVAKFPERVMLEAFKVPTTLMEDTLMNPAVMELIVTLAVVVRLAKVALDPVTFPPAIKFPWTVPLAT